MKETTLPPVTEELLTDQKIKLTERQMEPLPSEKNDKNP